MKILRVNMELEQAIFEDLPEAWKLIGGSGLIAAIMNREVPPDADPLGPQNKLIIAAGPLAGTMAPQLGRISVGAKSPLTYGIKEANAGGPAAQKLDRLNIRAIIVEGAPQNGKMYCLVITHQGARLTSADHFKGFKTYPLTDALHAEYGKQAAVICIGIGGERLYRSASVSLTDKLGDPSRNAARGGLGAVMGARGLKAVVIDAAGAPPVKMADPSRFKTAVKSWVHTLEHDVSCTLMSKFGTPFAVVNSSYTGSMPANNYTSGKPDGFKAVSAEAIQHRVFERGGKMHGCMPGCVVKCSILYPDEKGNRLAGAYEYEAIAMLGTNLGIHDPDAIAHLKFICDDLGVDVIEVGASLAVAASANKMTPGDETSAENLLLEIEKGTGFGDILANGVVSTAKALNVDRVPAYKGQAIPGHDPRGVKGTGVTYATSPMGADHTAGLTYRKPHAKSGQSDNSLRFQILAATCDTFGYCINAIPGGQASIYAFLAELANARFGTDLSSADIVDIGKQTLKDQIEYNKKTEFHTRHEPAPAFVRTEALSHTDFVFDVDDSEINRIWEGLGSYREPQKAWEVRMPKMSPLLLGPGVFRDLGKAAKAFGVSRFMIVSDPFMEKTGRTDEIRKILSASGMESSLFAEVEPDPPVALIERAGKQYEQENCKGIIAIGGGSSMDAGKAIALRVSHEGKMEEFESIMGGTAKIKPVVPPIITVPTTSGTGSDVNPYAVVTDTQRGVKFALFSEHLLPRLAVVDPNLCATMPPMLTAETGIDALSHCIEAYVALGTPYQPYCDALALQGAKLIGKSLRKAFRDGSGIAARTDMCMAAIFGGVAFSKSLGIAHAIGHALGAQHHISHGKSVALGLLFAVRANRKYCEEQYRDMAWALDRSDDLEQALLRLYGDLNMPVRIEDLGVPKSEFKKIAFAASREVANIASNPAPMDENKILDLLE